MNQNHVCVNFGPWLEQHHPHPLCDRPKGVENVELRLEKVPRHILIKQSTHGYLNKWWTVSRFPAY